MWGRFELRIREDDLMIQESRKKTVSIVTWKNEIALMIWASHLISNRLRNLKNHSKKFLKSLLT